MSRQRPNSPVQQGQSAKQRLDLLLVERDLVESREQARRFIMAGDVLVDEQVIDKPGKRAVECGHPRAQLAAIREPWRPQAGGALDDFALDVTGLIAVDVGASTGGFTDCLLQRGVRAFMRGCRLWSAGMEIAQR